jgi:uncharacterized membrane protein
MRMKDENIGRIGKPTVRFSIGKESNMLWTIFVILLVMWALGLVTSYTMGGFIHILVIIAIVMVLVNLISGRKRLI